MRKLILSFIVLIVSCSVGPDYKKPEFYSDKELEVSLNTDGQQILQSGNWYYEYNDSVLNDLVKKAVAQNIDRKVAIAKLRQARDSLRIAGVKYFPTFDINGKYDFSKSSDNLQQAVDYNYFQVGIDASWEFDLWGAGRRLSEEYKALLSAAMHNAENTDLAVIAEAVMQYINLRMSQELLKTAHENLKLQKNMFDLIDKKYKAGLADELAYNQAKYLLEQTSAQIPDLEYQIHAYRNALAILCGELPSEKVEESHGRNIVMTPLKFDLKKLKSYPISCLRNRPDIKSAEAELIAKNAKIGQAITAMYPNVSISALAGYQAFSGHRLFSSESSAYGYTPAINLPLFHWEALVNNVELQKDIYQQYLHTYQKVLLNAATELSNASKSVEKEYQRNKHLLVSFANISNAANLTTQKYKNGLVNFSEVLQAEQNMLAAQQNLVKSNAAIYLKVASFYKAMGACYYKTKD